MRKLAMIAAAVALLAVAAFAVAGAAAQEDDGPVGSFLAKVADKLGVSEDELQTAIDEARDETIDEAVADGRLTEQQAERLRESSFPFARPFQHHHHCLIEASAEVLGLTPEELIEQRREGNSLAQIAEAQGMSVDEFTAALLDQVQAQLDERVADGDLTQEQADAKLQRLEENIDTIVNAEAGPGPFGGRRGPHPFPGPHFGPPAEDETDSTQTSEVTP